MISWTAPRVGSTRRFMKTWVGGSGRRPTWASPRLLARSTSRTNPYGEHHDDRPFKSGAQMNPIDRAVGLIRNYVASNRLAPDEARQTLPMPGRTDGHQSVIIAFHMGESRPSKARKIWFPFLQAEALL